MKKYDIVALGEILIDFTPDGCDNRGFPRYIRNPGGAVANAVIFFNHNYYVMLIAWTLNAVVQFALWPATYKIISSQLCRSDRR